MDLNEDLVNIQGIFLALDKGTGNLKKIKFRGGNEATVVEVVRQLHKFLTSKHFIKNDEVNPIFDQQLNDIMMLLIFNTEIKTPFNDCGFENLIDVMPHLSCCLLANIVTELDLCKQYCNALQRFSLDITNELLAEMIPCLKKSKPSVHSKNAHLILQLMIGKVSLSTDTDSVEKASDIISQILLNLSGFHGDHIKTIKTDTVYELMGYNLFNLLDLLLLCNEKNNMLNRIIEKLLRNCGSIVVAITLDVFCSWAEIENDGQNLQTQIAEKAYLVIEKYQKHPPAKDLISKLGVMARKPITITEQICSANIPKIISMINKANADQKQWFTALLNSHVVDCEDSMKCIERWPHLCNLGDVTRLLTMSCRVKNARAKQMAVKCASTLELPDLTLAIARHFHKNGLGNNLNEDVQQQLVLLFNKIKDKCVEEEFNKTLILLLLQNPEQTLAFVFGECLKNSFYSGNLNSVLPSMKEVAHIDGMGIKILNQEIAKNTPNGHNCKEYVALFSALLESDFYSVENIFLSVILPIMQNCVAGQHYELLKHVLEIVNHLQKDLLVKEESECFYNFLFDLLKSCRCSFLDFESLKQEVVKEIVDVINRVCQLNNSFYTAQSTIKTDDIFVIFYQQKLYDRDTETDILKHFLPINFENHSEAVAHLIKILPRCVIQEWQEITSNLLTICGTTETTEILCDVAILLCDLVDSQSTKTEEVITMLNALKYCLQNVGIVIKECIQPRVQTLEDDVAVTKSVCRLVRYIPDGNLKSEEGLSLANLLTTASLKSLRTDKKFACLLVSIKESRICQMLAQKILN